MSLKKNFSDPYESCMLFRDEWDEPLEKCSIKKKKVDPLEEHNFSVKQALAYPLEECMLFRDENDEPLDILENSFPVNKSNEQIMEISTLKKEQVDLLEDDCQLIAEKTYEPCHKKIAIVRKEPVDFLEEKCMLNTDKTGEISQEDFIIKRRYFCNQSKEECHLITDKEGKHSLEVKINKKTLDIFEDECLLNLDKNNDFPHEITITNKERDDLNLDKCCSVTDQNYEVSSNTTSTKKNLDGIQSSSIKNEYLVPFEECLLMDNAQQYCLPEGSHIKQESVDPFKECMDMDETKINCAPFTSSMEEESFHPFKESKPSEKHYSVEPLDGRNLRKPYIKVKSPNLLLATIKADSKEETGEPLDNRIVRKPFIKVKSPNLLFAAFEVDKKEETGVSSKVSLMGTRKQLPCFQGSVSPIITIRKNKDIQVSEDKKLQYTRFNYGLFYDPPERIDEGNDDYYLSFISKKILPRINMKHSCTSAVLCPECNHCFDNLGSLRSHLVYGHGLKAVPRYYCCKCKELFQDIYDLMNHMTKESGQILVYCCFCDGSFVIRKHADNFLYRTSFYVKREKCKLCKKMFSSVEFLKRHVCPVASVMK